MKPVKVVKTYPTQLGLDTRDTYISVFAKNNVVKQRFYSQFANKLIKKSLRKYIKSKK